MVYAPLYNGPSPNIARKKVTFGTTSGPSSEHGSEEIRTSGPSPNRASEEVRIVGDRSTYLRDLTKVRIAELLRAPRAQDSTNYWLGYPGNILYARSGRQPVRLANDGRAYTRREFLKHYGEDWGHQQWYAGRVASGYEKHKALLRLLEEENNYTRGWKVLGETSSADILPYELLTSIIEFLLPAYWVHVWTFTTSLTRKEYGL